MKLPTGRLAFLFGLVVCSFGAGLLYEHEKFFPYMRMANLYRRVRGGTKTGPARLPEMLASQRRLESGDQSFEKSLDSALLPLRLTGYRCGTQAGIAKFAGGIAAVGRRVLMVDRLGAGFVFADGKLAPLALPPVPMNLEGFLKTTSLTNENFRVHDVEYLAAAKVLFVSHELFDDTAKQTRLAISRISFDAATLQATGEWSTIWRGDLPGAGQPPAYPGGGRMFADGGQLYFTTIDYIPDDVTHPTPPMAQDPKSTFGKVLSLDLKTGEAAMVSLGHRNPHGLLKTQAGEWLSLEHGPAGGDELNLIQQGANYGFPNVTLGTEYDSYGWPPGTAAVGRHDGFTPPVFAWVPSVATSNLIELKNFHPRWDGDLLVASLKAGSLFRLRREGARVLYAEPIWVGERIRDLAQLDDGRIVLWTDNANLLFVAVDEAKLAANRKVSGDSPASLGACLGCHHFGPTNPAQLAPTLSNLVGRAVAADDFAHYSDALKKAGGTWDAPRLQQFLADPAKFAPGTTMPRAELTATALEAIVRELQAH